ncbi:hypothetical protein [Nannocystis punicea]|uniref:Uncharacterized protein n=1 Tax=Nannocystis punicea TaxID=2995304 RepID=A0ABY7HI77_9BACT|nr:hypothetical protein [Nannocystis poenicansa]WAS99030.1 hypothetical protein O0S08_23115 [Nannocystis poenicansa]
MQPVHSSVASPAHAASVVADEAVVAVELAAVVASVVGSCVVVVVVSALVLADDVVASEVAPVSTPLVVAPLVVASVPDTGASVDDVDSAPQASAAAKTRKDSGDRAGAGMVMSATMVRSNDIHFQ